MYQKESYPVDAMIMDEESQVLQTASTSRWSHKKLMHSVALSGFVLLLLAFAGHFHSKTADVTPMAVAIAPVNLFVGTTTGFARSPKISKAQSRRAVAPVQAMAAAASPVARGYADALLEACEDSNNLETVHQEIDFLAEYFKTNPQVLGFLANPTVEDQKKKEIVTKLNAEAELSKYTVNFLNLLISKRRMDQVENIFGEFDALYYKKSGVELATVTSAVPLSEEQMAKLADKLKSLTSASKVQMKQKIDKSLLGGFVLTYGKDGSENVDLSVKGQVDTLAQSFS